MTKLPSNRRLAVLSTILLLTTIAIAASAQAAAPEPAEGPPVPGAEDVRWKKISTVNDLFLTREDETQRTDLADLTNNYGTLTTEEPNPPIARGQSAVDVAQLDPFLVKDVVQSQSGVNFQTEAKFQTQPLARDVTVTGANSIDAEIHVIAPPKLDWTIKLVECRDSSDENQCGNKITVARADFVHDEQTPFEGYRPNITLSETLEFTDKAKAQHGKFSWVFEEGNQIQIEVFARHPDGDGINLKILPGEQDKIPANRFVWLLRREGPSTDAQDEAPLAGASHVTLRSDDAVQAAGWLEDHRSQVSDIFTNHTDDDKDEIEAQFAIRSAFGSDDIDDLDARLELKRNDPATGQNVSYLMQPGDNASVEMEEDPGLTVETPNTNIKYQKGWELPDKYWNYDEAPSGQYQAHMSVCNFRGSTSCDGPSRQWNFRLTDQSVEASVFPLDSNSHLVKPGSSTTFLLDVVNTGSTKDTYDIDVRFAEAAQAGWTADVEAPGLKASNRLTLDPGEKALTRVTVAPPQDAPLEQSQSFTVNVTSTIDDEATKEVTLIATTSNESPDPKVNLLGGQDGPDALLGPEDNGTATLYVWNNATSTNDINVALRNHDDLTNWNVSIRAQGRIDESMTVKGVAPGDVEALDVHFQTLGDNGATSQPVIVNASIAGVPETIVELDVLGQVEMADGVQVEILNAIEGTWRHLEMQCGQSTQTALICPDESGIPRLGVLQEEPTDRDTDDAVELTLFRTWVKNTGDETETFNLEATGFKESTIKDIEPYRCRHAFTDPDFEVENPQLDPNQGLIPDTSVPETEKIRLRSQTCRLETDGDSPQDDPLQYPPEIVRKTSNGVINDAQRKDSLDLAPGETAEYYVVVDHRTDVSSYAPSEFEFSVVAECVTDDECVAQGRDNVKVRGDNGVEDRSHVLVEPVARLEGYNDVQNSPPLVETGNSTQSTLSKSLLPGQQDHIDYRVRVTHGASFAHGGSEDAEITVSLTGVEEGWDAKFKPLTNQTPETDTGFVDEFTFDNCVNDNCPNAMSYQDREFLVRVTPPEPGSEDAPLAGDSASVILQADSPFGSDFTKLRTEVESVPRLNITPGSVEEPVPAGEQTSYLVGLENVGSAQGTFAFSVETPPDWQASPSNDNFTIESQKSRSLPLIVKAPDAAQVGRQVPIIVEATWNDEVEKNWEKSELDCNAQGEPVNPDAPVACQRLTTRVVPDGSLGLSAEDSTSATLQPNGQQSFSFDVENERQNSPMNVELDLVAPPKWTAQLSRTEFTGDGDLDAGENRSVNLVVRAPSDVVEGSSHAFVVKAQDRDDPDNVALETFTVGIVDGTPRPVVDVDEPRQLIERGSFQTFEVEVENRGSAEDTFQLRTDGPDRDGWDARIEDRTGLPVDEVRLVPNQQKTVYVNVTAPFEDVPEGVSVQPSLLAFDSSFKSKAEAQLTAEIQDYGVALSMPETEVEYVPGTRHDVPLTIRNTGNGNDTINVSMSLQGLENEWSVTFDDARVRLEPGEEETVEAEIRSPRSPLPSSRTITFTSWAGTVRGAAVEEWQNRSVPFVVNILEYRSQDVDGDGFVELAVDDTPARPNDGFPTYREIYPEGQNATLRVAFDGDDDGKNDFLLDDPGEGGIDGIADIYWDPDDIVVYRIQHRPDVTYDKSPDYLIDADGDTVIDTFWNSRNETSGKVDAINLGNDADLETGQRQYVIDSNGDGDFDKFHDPASGVISEVTSEGPDQWGLDTTGDDAVDTYYDSEDQEVEAATFQNASTFAQDYWYLVILFAVVVVVGGVAISRR